VSEHAGTGQPEHALDIIAPDGWPRGSGYAHGTAARGRVVFAAGQVGWEPATRRIASADFAAQVEQALDNVLAVLRAGGAEPGHVARMTWYITDREAYMAAQQRLGAAWRTRFGRHYPAMSVVVVAGLIEDGALVEIEATAVIPD
jgi:enamine deaminase RidA (YjgF/YER057c/UK114 family)